MPWGSAMGSDDDGDLNRLVHEYGWTAQQLAEFYLNTTHVAFAIVTVVYLYHVAEHFRTRRDEIDASV
ncbi:MAG: hypothetical protein R3A47_12060 [Polyangiales bacterium]